MQDEEKPPDRSTASTENAARWRRFDRALQETRALLADIPPQELQAVIDEACAAVRQEMWPCATGKKETS